MYNNNFYCDDNQNHSGESHYYSSTYRTQPPAPTGSNPETPKKSGGSKRNFALILCACILTSSVMGFSGGLIASNLNSGTAETSSSAVETAATTATPVASTGSSIVSVAEAASNSVVEITTEATVATPFMTNMTTSGAGSGVIISEDGYIVTNNHVIENSDNITVRLKNGESYDAVLIGTDSKTDVAVIKIDAAGLSAAALGDSDALSVGEDAVAIGNPLGELGGTVTNGIISALDREINLDGETMNLLQTNAAINPGNSGGGLFNSKGELIGIVVAKSGGNNIEGLGFAIPINDVKQVITDLMTDGFVRGRTSLGVTVVQLGDSRQAQMPGIGAQGVYIQSVSSASNAERAGLRAGDRIEKINNTAITTTEELSNAIEPFNVGDSFEISITRNGQPMTLTVQLQEDVPVTSDLYNA